MAARKQSSAPRSAGGKKKAPTHSRPGAPPSGETAAPPFPVVGIGASAGGLEALETMFQELPVDPGLALVVITHTDPKHTSMLPGIIKRRTGTKVRLIEDGMPVEPDTIYFPPSDRDPLIDGGRFVLKERPSTEELHMPIDRFLKQLAGERGGQAACVILSGTGSDGAHGLRAVKEKAGLTVVQDPASARHRGMPESAINTDLVDFVIAPEEIPRCLVDYFRQAATIKPESDKTGSPPDRMHQILSFLAKRTRHDFSLYKASTLQRRVGRRIAVTHSRDADDYLKVLYKENEEVQALFHDLLIGVTSFFRDPEAFEHLETEVLPGLVARHRPGMPLRVWIPGCATGEETYSVAMLFREVMDKQEVSCDLQIFGTDIDPRAIEKARAGVYPPNIGIDVGRERLKRFFTKEGDNYRIRREIREPVVFAEQNLLRDPPFSDLDLLVCRNLLIYLRSEAQDRLIPLFHYTLKKDGILFLGNSETIGRFPELFKPMSKTHSIYRKRKGHVATRIHFPTGRNESVDLGEARFHQAVDSGEHAPSLEVAVEKTLLQAFIPACVVVDPRGEILYTRGRTGKYLELAQGKPNLNVADMAREGLRFALTSALREARDADETIRVTGLKVKTNGGHQWLDLMVRRLGQPPYKDALLITFHDSSGPQTAAPTPVGSSGGEPDPVRVKSLEEELMRLRQEYRSAREELETSNEELRSTNEEMHSSNEELQSTNEELESSREELQSLNEELNTVNDELQNKIQELRDAYRAVTETLNSTRIAIVMLDRDLKVTRFTQAATRLINFIDTDLGRPLEHISTALEVDDLSGMAARVMDTLEPIEEEVRSESGNWYRMNVMIRRSGDHLIEGVVMTFINIDPQKAAQAEIEATNRQSTAASRRFAENIVDASREALLVLDDKLKVVMANRRFYERFRTDSEKTVGQYLYELGHGQWDIPKLHTLLAAVTQKRETFEDYRIDHDFPDIGRKVMLLNARYLLEDDETQNRILLAIEDLTGREGRESGAP